jgi:(1->4)-alpha-D-glucan 1-alpha-D-glucosylmutase
VDADRQGQHDSARARSGGSGARIAATGTYRFQLHDRFTFDDAAAQVERVADLGISHVYCSPILQAAAGSTHGYDIVDPTRVSDALGGRAGFLRLAHAAGRAGLGVMVDIVPNHMARSGRSNPWWWDVLAHGPDSRYVDHFDLSIDGGVDPDDAWPLLVPVLEDHLGRVVESGILRIERDAAGAGTASDGGYVVRYHEREFPLAPGSVEAALEELGLDDAGLAELNADPDALEAVLDRQHYRLASWRTANEELDSRRFFNVDTLIGVRVEDEEVLADTHATLLGLVHAGAIDGLRVDHVDGLRDPEGYLHRLRQLVGPEVRVVVEKILAGDEPLPSSWPVEGTTGYDFAALVDGLFVDGAREDACTKLHERATGCTDDWDEVVHTAKFQVMRDDLAAEVDALTKLLAQVCAEHRRHRDHTRRELRYAIRELLASFDVYRTYVQPARATTEVDRGRIAAAVERARRRRPDLDDELFTFLGEVLELRHPGRAATEFALRFPQISAPVMAKGVEDTAGYRWFRLLSLNEVGAEPGRFGRDPADFHAWCATAADRHPATMLGLSTHDSKRSGDVRARIHLLSELPDAWADAFDAFATAVAPHRGEVHDALFEYELFQTLVGVWPAGRSRDGSEPLPETLVDRLADFADKATREAKLHTSWTKPDPTYDAGIRQLLRVGTADPAVRAVLDRFVADHRLVELGRANALAAHALLLTAPGLPDVYQGTEVWADGLVDPDNRRPVDHGHLADLAAALDDGVDPWALADDGGPKLALTRAVLRDRRAHPDRYAGGEHRPLHVRGEAADHVVAWERGDLAVVVPRLLVGLDQRGGWGDTTIALPPGRWTEVCSGIGHDGGDRGRDLPVGDAIGPFGVAVLGRGPDGSHP